MGASKNEGFTEQQNRLSNLFKALAHPARVAIVEHLLSVKTCVCGELVDELPLAQSTISQHLKELKHAGLIRGTVVGPSVCYCLCEEAIEELHDFLKRTIETLTLQQKDCC